MRIPNSNSAFISKNKISDYLFSLSHPIGRHKASFFLKYGFDSSSVEFMIDQLKSLISDNDFVEKLENNFGTKYVITGFVNSPTGNEIELVTVWFVEKGEDMPYFVTAYPKRK